MLVTFEPLLRFFKMLDRSELNFLLKPRGDFAKNGFCWNYLNKVPVESKAGKGEVAVVSEVDREGVMLLNRSK